MDDKRLEQKVQELMNEGYKLSQSDNPDPMLVDKLDMEITSLNASVGQRYREYEFKASIWKQYNKDLQEIARSCRRIHETLNTERRSL